MSDATLILNYGSGTHQILLPSTPAYDLPAGAIAIVHAAISLLADSCGRDFDEQEKHEIVLAIRESVGMHPRLLKPRQQPT